LVEPKLDSAQRAEAEERARRWRAEHAPGPEAAAP